MNTSKNKIVAQAQRFTAKGQFEKAIIEYRRLLKVDPTDIRTWLKIGDLYTRTGARKEATETYIRVAEQYTKSGFHLKAIAVYKQVLNLDPTLALIHKYLAAAYLELGLTSEALIQLEQLADSYQRTGRSELLLEVLLQMGGIDGRNIATRLRIAELFSKENRIPDATKHFALACDELKKQGRKEDFVKVGERLFYHDPSRLDIAREMAEVYVEQGRFKEALSKLQACFVSNPKDPATLELLASTFRGLHQPEKAISVYEEIYGLLEEIGDRKKQRAIIQEILALDPENEKARSRISSASSSPGGSTIDEYALINTVLEDAPLLTDEPPSADELPTDKSRRNTSALPAPEFSNKCQSLMNEVQVLLKYGLRERALDHLEHIFEIDSSYIEARELARDILMELGRPLDAMAHLFLLAEAFEETQPEGSVYYLHEVLKIDSSNERARQMINALGGIMPPGSESQDNGLGEESEELLLLDDDEDILLVDDDDLQRAHKAIADGHGATAPHDEWGDFSIEDVDTSEDPDLDFGFEGEAPLNGAIEPTNSVPPKRTAFSSDAPEILVADSDEGERTGSEISVEIETNFDEPAEEPMSEGDSPFDLTPIDLVKTTATSIEIENELVVDIEEEPPADDEDASVVHIEEEPTTDDEDASVVHIEEEPTTDDEDASVVHIEEEPTTDDEDASVVHIEEEQATDDEDASVVDIEGEPIADIDDEIEEIDFFMGQELLDEARNVLDDLIMRHARDPRVQELVGRLAAMSTRVTSEMPAPMLDPPSQATVVIPFNMFENGSVQFKNVGLQQKLLQSDTATNWDLGLAYKEMGLFEDAIQAFEIVSRDPKKFGSAKTMIGMCLVSLNRMDDAVKTFEQSLAEGKLDDQQKMGLLYELGKTSQMMGNRDKALSCFEEIRDVDKSFADIALRISALRRAKAKPAAR